jgi:prophage DNA circulation protein
MNGKIHSSVGFTKTDGAQRQLTITEQLRQVVNSRTDGMINHPVHGRIKVGIYSAESCIKHNIDVETLTNVGKMAFHYDN